MKPDEILCGLPWHDGKVIYRSGDEAVPMAIAVTEHDAAAIVTALAAVGAPGHICTHWLDVGEKSHRPGGSMFCEAPAVAIVEGVGRRCIAHIAPGVTVSPVDHHPDLWPAVRRLLAATLLPAGEVRDVWVNRCIGDLATMRLGFVSRVRDEHMPAAARAELAGA